MARKHPQDSYSDADYGYEEEFDYEEEEESLSLDDVINDLYSGNNTDFEDDEI